MTDDEMRILAERNALLETEKRMNEITRLERVVSDTRYAIKLVEYIVFGMIGLIAVGVITALLTLVLR